MFHACHPQKASNVFQVRANLKFRTEFHIYRLQRDFP
uniref:Uncharacterized protein n=1 Tax=Arundo donax TaxID=35708 RepID=A0A0A9SGZ6_ARUDO